MNSKRLLLLPILVAAFGVCPNPACAQDQSAAVRATLPNGMRVVIVRNTLAPVVTVEANFLVGGDETPAGFPGMAHAQEHMAFRGCAGMTADQTAAIYAQLGGRNNADTQQNITQYFATVPAADLDVALQAQAACLHGIDDSQQEWSQERGAIEQEVARDLSNPTYKFIDRLNQDMFAGTPYAHDPLGTKDSFDATTGEMLKDFYSKWYTPSNVHPGHCGRCRSRRHNEKGAAMVRRCGQPSLACAAQVDLKPVKSETFTLDSNLPYMLGFIAYRFPGTDSPDYAASQILADVLASQRADLYGMVPAGKALAAEFGMAETYPKASVGYGVVVLPAGRGRQQRHRARCAAFLRTMRRRACPTIWSRRPFAARLPRPSFSGIPSRAWQTCGRMRWLPKDASLPMRTLKPSSASRLPM